MTCKAFLFLAVFVLSACQQQSVDLHQRFVAKVGGVPILARDVIANLKQLKAEQDDISAKNPKLIEQLKERALNEVILQSVLRAEAEKRGVRVERADVDGRLSNWKEGYPIGGFEEMLRKKNTTEEFLKRRIEDQLLTEKVAESAFPTETMVSDDEIKAYYQQHEREFIRPERVHAQQIVVPTKEEAELIRQNILAGKLTFESAARQFSLSPDASKGGDLGFFAKDDRIKAFNAAFSLNVGGISAPISSEYGFHILKLLEKTPQRRLSLSEARTDILLTLKGIKEVRVFKEWATKLLKDVEIYRNEEVFAAIN